MKAYVGLGSNLDSPDKQIDSALLALENMDQTTLVAISSLYINPPMGPQDQPDYLNAVAEIDTTLGPSQLLDQLQKIEHQQGRNRERRWGERTIDLDILLYGQDVVDDERLQIPHPGVAERPFVLVPLAEIAGAELNVPGEGMVGELLQQCDCGEMTKIEIRGID
ncbi:MAG: 2-amino-4-hydroxy-6-hydroxymethyldihydropteridine diphosphokinase [Gammaproteobacteria bacterium]|uniref:2-amino-4-hydroxy-6-hydroxymethyldihydropteridine pyrophosphokinase n=1 Tax=Candidatus Thiopontia autotrophica TaxID=2841688 RepID=A0A8J6TQ06_9GAMM|nr:2-amino-4-hydroxy-6-hydroxymethyldihydropteridine diphosphokinase [Candidatus Thiopontia autotrophica]MBL6968672.1 2-amino-4-hydroxy-6-hydroxymethyldihydropteridine diphosphokinase [Gammaproteobacteria bacterium]